MPSTKVLFGIADLIEMGVVIKEWPRGGIDIRQRVSPSPCISAW
ncbi:unnamed protein product [Acidithrix sp. C25]|nr:unnamed protein product [Acidithrix sp. C25]